MEAVERIAALERVLVNGHHVLLLILSSLCTNIFDDGTLLEVGKLSAQDWNQAKTTPCFYYQPVEEVGSGSNIGLLPIGDPEWRCRFTPEQTGNWQYKIKVTEAGGTNELEGSPFEVIPCQVVLCPGLAMCVALGMHPELRWLTSHPRWPLYIIYIYIY